MNMSYLIKEIRDTFEKYLVLLKILNGIVGI